MLVQNLDSCGHNDINDAVRLDFVSPYNTTNIFVHGKTGLGSLAFLYIKQGRPVDGNRMDGFDMRFLLPGRGRTCNLKAGIYHTLIGVRYPLYPSNATTISISYVDVLKLQRISP